MAVNSKTVAVLHVWGGVAGQGWSRGWAGWRWLGTLYVQHGDVVAGREGGHCGRQQEGTTTTTESMIWGGRCEKFQHFLDSVLFQL